MSPSEIDRRQFIRATTAAAGAAAVAPHLLSAADRRIAEPELEAPGATKVYRGEFLEAVRLPLGGIGAGTIQINGRAERHVWQIFNNLTQGRVRDSFFGVRARRAGGEPVVAEVDAASGKISPDAVQELIAHETAAVLGTHLHGIGADIDPIKEMCKSVGALLLEDTAQAFGAKLHAQRLGTLGVFGLFCFGTSKNICAWYGGAVAL